jgi:hypothetical protein
MERLPTPGYPTSFNVADSAYEGLRGRRARRYQPEGIGLGKRVPPRIWPIQRSQRRRLATDINLRMQVVVSMAIASHTLR